MARKKPNATSRSKPDTAAAQNATSADSTTGTPAKPDFMNSEINGSRIPSEASVRLEYSRAYEALLQGNHAEALRLMDDLASKCENTPHSASVHRFHGGICSKVACMADDPDAKLSHMKNALSHAKMVVGLCPRTIEYALFYAQMLRDLGNEEEAVEECERALSIENPECPEAYIDLIQGQLRQSIQESNIAIISRWMNGEESRGRRVVVDPIEIRLLEVLDKKPESLGEGLEARIAADRIRRQAQNSANEMKNVTEEQEKDIEEQSMPEASQPRNMADEQRKEIAERLTAEASQQRNPVKTGKAAASPEVPDWVKSYWDSLSSELKKDLLTIKVSDLKKHLRSSKDRALIEVLDEAIFFEVVYIQSWKIWSCRRCNKNLGTPELLVEHVAGEHWVSSLANTGQMRCTDLPELVDPDYLHCSSWEPVDLNAATKILEEMPKSGDDNSIFDWPSSKDPERTELLLEIYSLFNELERKCLASYPVSKVTKFAMDELKGLACGSAAEKELKQTIVCIRFLGAPELKRIKKFLEKVSKPLKSKEFTNRYSLVDFDSAVEGIEIIEKIRVEENGSLLVIDEQSLPCKIDDVSTAPNASHVVFDNGVILDSDALLSWIFTGESSSLSAQLASWKLAMVPTKENQKWFQMYMLEFDYIKRFCLEKYELLSNEEALMVLENLCLEEGKKKDRQDYEKFLEERCEEQNICKAQLDVMRNVLKKAKLIKSGEISFEEAYYGGITSLPKDCWRKKAHLHEADSYVEAAIQKQRDEITSELGLAEVAMLRVVLGMKPIRENMVAECCHDFRSILFPLIKSFMKAQLEDVAKIEATKKADAVANELLLAELPLESKKGKKNVMKKKKNTGK